MSVAYELEATVVALERAREHAIGARLGEHFVSEIDHLLATAQANKDIEGCFFQEIKATPVDKQNLTTEKEG